MSQRQQICQTPSSGGDICSTTVNKPLTSWRGWLLLLLLIRFTLIRFLINCTSDCNSLPTLTHWSSQPKNHVSPKSRHPGSRVKADGDTLLELPNSFYEPAMSYIFQLIDEKARFVIGLIWSSTRHGHTRFSLTRLWDSRICALVCSAHTATVTRPRHTLAHCGLPAGWVTSQVLQRPRKSCPTTSVFHCQHISLRRETTGQPEGRQLLH